MIFYVPMYDTNTALISDFFFFMHVRSASMDLALAGA